MSSIIIYHNPQCLKSRQTLELLKSKGVNPEVVEYLKTPPTVEELDQILKSLKLEPEAIVRKNEDLYKELGLKDKKLSRLEYLKVLVKNPKLIERPIVVKGNLAVIGRPPENVLQII